ncbi:hypothetical protein CXF80_19070 [Shewanella sp. Actino-trap-3]|nr:hypothetical protein CXF80_19070 [Shewanella sp. Actino-trap-3]
MDLLWVGKRVNLYIFLWPTATNVVALRPHQTKRKPTAVPSLLFIKELAPAIPATFSLFTKTTAAKRLRQK